MSDYNELYQQVILEHNKKPRNFTVMESPSGYALGKNPLCGDQFMVYVKLADDGTVEDISFQGEGCAIAKASASLMTIVVKGKTCDRVLQMKDDFQKMVTGQLSDEQAKALLGRLAILAGVKDYPMRVKCATLAWHTMSAALKGEQSTISTES